MVIPRVCGQRSARVHMSINYLQWCLQIYTRAASKSRSSIAAYPKQFPFQAPPRGVYCSNGPSGWSPNGFPPVYPTVSVAIEVISGYQARKQDDIKMDRSPNKTVRLPWDPFTQSVTGPLSFQFPNQPHSRVRARPKRPSWMQMPGVRKKHRG
jgi:hypothetical protein